MLQALATVEMRAAFSAKANWRGTAIDVDDHAAFDLTRAAGFAFLSSRMMDGFTNGAFHLILHM